MIAPALAPATFTHFFTGLSVLSANPSNAPARPSPLTPPPRKTPSASSIHIAPSPLARGLSGPQAWDRSATGARGQGYGHPVAQPTTVAEVVARMKSIAAPLPRGDGVNCFTRLYLAVTQGVKTDLGGTMFHDARFVERLDIVFA